MILADTVTHLQIFNLLTYIDIQFLTLYRIIRKKAPSWFRIVGISAFLGAVVGTDVFWVFRIVYNKNWTIGGSFLVLAVCLRVCILYACVCMCLFVWFIVSVLCECVCVFVRMYVCACADNTATTQTKLRHHQTSPCLLSS